VITLAIDAMGGDRGLATTIPASIQALKVYPLLTVQLVGDEPAITQALSQYVYDASRVTIVHAAQVVEMDEAPSKALRGKKQSSMRLAIDAVHEGRAQAVVSAGNTGALMATAKFVLKTLPGIERPAICGVLPKIGGHTLMLDLGANVGASGENLLQFALMGHVLAQAVNGVENPSIGLLNIGQEEMKGHARIWEADALLRQWPLNYVGYVEGNEICTGQCDVVVCDGFDGNIALKASEGVAKMVRHYMKAAFMRTWWTKALGLIASPVLKAFAASIDPRRYNGASLLGLRGIVVKSHGGADAVAFEYAIRQAILEVEKQVPTRIAQDLEKMMVGSAT
jgi:glycerol-3-phosphate acyltransferase PlsX